MDREPLLNLLRNSVEFFDADKRELTRSSFRNVHFNH